MAVAIAIASHVHADTCYILCYRERGGELCI